MPYLPFSELDEQKKKAQTDGQVNISGSSGTVNQAAQNVAAPKPVQRSGTWTNLNSYLDANKEQSNDMGNTISNKITDTGGQVRTGIQNSQDDFNSQVDKGTISNLAGAKTDSDSIINSAKNNGYGNQINDDQVKRFNEVSNATYKGPNDLSASQYYSDTQKNLNKANDYKSNAQSDEGRFNLLQEMFNRPTYSQGQKSLDNLLIQGNQQAKTNISNAATGLNDLQGLWDKAGTDAQGLATQRKSDIDSARQYSQDALSSNRNNKTSEVDADLANKQAHWADQYNHYNDLLSNYKGGDLELSQDEANKLALNGNGQQIFNTLKGVPATTYLDLAGYDANKVVNKDQFSQLSALDKLANQFGAASTSKFSDINQAGTLGLDNNFDASRFGTAATQAGTDFSNYAKSANFNGTGHNEQTYYDGLFHNNKHTTTADASANQNLQDYLNGIGSTADPSHTGTVGSFDPMNLIMDPTSLANQAVGGIDLTGSGAHSGAVNDAQRNANLQARQQIYSQILDALGTQGYDNKIKIK